MIRWMAVLALVGCGDNAEKKHKKSDTDSDAVVCTDSNLAVATDIDETLTISDAEWLEQRLTDPDKEPEMRPSASDAFNAYADLGYTVVYVTARGVDIVIADGRTATDATHQWLVDHSFPTIEGNLHLAEGPGVSGDAAADYKAAVLADLEGQGLEFVYGYGDKSSDIEAWQAAGIPDDQIFHVGKDTTEHGVEVLPDAAAYAQHLADYIATVPSACAR